MNVFITGGAGFIGSQLVEFHLERGDVVVAVDDLSTGRLSNVESFLENPDFYFEEDNLVTTTRLNNWVSRADRIYHMAAVVGMFRVLKDPVKVTQVNVLGTERLFQSVIDTGVMPRILVASSSSVYGHSHQSELREDLDLVLCPEKEGLTAYAASKLTNEIQAMAYYQAHGLPVAIPRLFNTVGPRQSGTYGFVLPRFVKQALACEPLTVFGDGTQTRSFCDVRDTVEALSLLAGTPKAWGEVVNVGNTREISILELAELVIKISDSSSTISFVPFEKGYGKRFEQITQRHPVIEKLKRLTGFQPALALEETIADLLDAANRGLEPAIL